AIHFIILNLLSPLLSVPPSPLLPLLFPLLNSPPSIRTLFPYTTLFRSQDEELSLQLNFSEDTFSGEIHIPSFGTYPLEGARGRRSEEHTSELQSRFDLVCRLLQEKKNKTYDASLTHSC